MAVWLVRAGKHGEYEQKFFDDGMIYLTWKGLNTDFSKLNSQAELIEQLNKFYVGENPNKLKNHASQLWPFGHDMKIGDMVVVPLKAQRAIKVGVISGEYNYEPTAQDPYFHSRKVDWQEDAVPRDHFSQDLLYSFGAFMTVCRIQRNNAENRLEQMRKNGWKPELVSNAIKPLQAINLAASDESEDALSSNIEETARDQIASLIATQFSGHNLTRLIEQILKAQGYTTYRSPEGADGGVDIIAGSGPLGFSSPRLCVEVKSGDTPIDRPTVDKLLGALTKFGADEGLFVSWSGFKRNVSKELASSFFKVRLWSDAEIMDALFANYERMDESFKAELPLKKIWTVADTD